MKKRNLKALLCGAIPFLLCEKALAAGEAPEAVEGLAAGYALLQYRVAQLERLVTILLILVIASCVLWAASALWNVLTGSRRDDVRGEKPATVNKASDNRKETATDTGKTARPAERPETKVKSEQTVTASIDEVSTELSKLYGGNDPVREAPPEGTGPLPAPEEPQPEEQSVLPTKETDDKQRIAELVREVAAIWSGGGNTDGNWTCYTVSAGVDSKKFRKLLTRVRDNPEGTLSGYPLVKTQEKGYQYICREGRLFPYGTNENIEGAWMNAKDYYVDIPFDFRCAASASGRETMFNSIKTKIPVRIDPAEVEERPDGTAIVKKRGTIYF